MTPHLYVALVHHPVKNKKGETVTTSVTNLDIHDIARSSETFGVRAYFIVTPLVPQHALIQEVLSHWEEDHSSIYNPDRHQALKKIQLTYSLDHARRAIENMDKALPLEVATGANLGGPHIREKELLLALEQQGRPGLLVFGTGHGLCDSVVEECHFRLPPIVALGSSYNHLSVRSAVAIYLDRLFGHRAD